MKRIFFCIQIIFGMLLASGCVSMKPNIDLNPESQENQELRRFIFSADFNVIDPKNFDLIEKSEASIAERSLIEQAPPEVAANVSFVCVKVIFQPGSDDRYYWFYQFSNLGLVEGVADVVVLNRQTKQVTRVGRIFFKDGIDEKMLNILPVR